ncbi:MAG: 2-(1,2-epoxy-1,2-dihydrophenyl)acetyl-CoA isomerase [Candidatus Eisenbacteria bacterium]|uniref:2-(1,2-epoxy-1,2-dihydrophenyl)acetyl-CoA isomerase n=1 Tax=Eiseniibacteriota bacterium TaxID=2212470 RepID=A0A849ST76_UNCEI|nr:2-(1,2-epoxy-1,2-dihydrophenyl)acetyl-CoA isomerase [Candidatus Eisenbacteria bacterium]
MTDPIVLSIADGVATVLLNRPDKLNAFAGDMRERLVEALDAVVANAEVRALVITGAGRGFCAGGDVQHMVDLKRRGAPFEELQPLLEAGRAIVTRLASLPIPTLAAVNGVAAGAGMNLALACDLRIAAEQASFGATFVRIGLHPDWGGTYFLTRLVGEAKAKELCWTGDVIDAGEALRIGLVQRVVPNDQALEATIALARRLAAAPATSVRESKRSLAASHLRSLSECLDAEAAAQEACWNHADVAEGLTAFVEKRAARFGSRGGEAPASVGRASTFE